MGGPGRLKTVWEQMASPRPTLRCKFGSDGHGNQSKHRNMKLLSDFHIREEKTNEALREVNFLPGCACVRVRV